jgi:hypothetical protein
MCSVLKGLEMKKNLKDSVLLLLFYSRKTFVKSNNILQTPYPKNKQVAA